MLKKLRTKFILTNTLYVGIVLIIVSVAVGAYTYRHTRSEVVSALRAILTMDPDKEFETVELGRGGLKAYGAMPPVYALEIRASSV